MPQMKPMLWLMMLTMTLTIIMLTIIINFFSSTMMYNNKHTQSTLKTIKWKW